jgi:hypothetical protein
LRWWRQIRQSGWLSRMVEGDGVMEPISLIVGALAAGTAAGLMDSAAGAVKDAYVGLRDLVRRRFAGRKAAETVLAEHEKAPHVWHAPLSAELSAVGADTDAQIIAAAAGDGFGG